MADMPHYYNTRAVLSLCPAPSGTRIAYAQEDVEGGIWYQPCYFMAVCDCQRWVQRPPFDEKSPPEKDGEPTREIHPVFWSDDGLIDVEDCAENFLALLAPGRELNETNDSVIAARKAALDYATGGGVVEEAQAPMAAS